MTDEDIHKDALKRLNLGLDADRDNDELALDDLQNLIGEQWPDSIKTSREADSRPCLTLNRHPQFVRQVTGDIRAMNPAVKVYPADSEATKEGAELLEGVVRQIQYASDASSVYESAGESAAACGKGAFRILTQYCDEQSFDQEIILRAIKNPFSVVWDPRAVMSTREDAEWCFVRDRMTMEDFRVSYPDAAEVNVRTDDRDIRNWRAGDEIVVAEYFWREAEEKTIGITEAGQVVEGTPKGIKFAKTRKVVSHKVRWAKVSGSEILEGPQDFPSKYLPIIAVMGEEIHVGDRVYRSSVIRHAKDAQRMYNYWRSAQTEMVALQPKAPYLVTPKQIANHETEWSEANAKNFSYLLVNPDEKAPGWPQRQPAPVPSAGMMQEVALAADDMKATTGIYDSALGNKSNEQSGIAIQRRQRESDVSTSIYPDNVNKAVAHCGRIMLDMIPRIYDTQRVMQIIGADDAQTQVMVNQQVMTQAGPQTINSLTVGRYAARVSVGPNYTTKRQETAQSMQDMAQAYPPLMQLAGDIMVKNMDWPGAEQVAERLKKALPPGIADDQPDPQQQQVAQQQAQAQAVQMQMAQQMAMLQLEEQQAKTEQAKAIAGKAASDAAKAEVEAHVAALQAGIHPDQLAGMA